MIKNRSNRNSRSDVAQPHPTASDPLPDDPTRLRKLYRETLDELEREFGPNKERRAALLEATPDLQRLFKLRFIECNDGQSLAEALEFAEIVSGLDNAEKEDWKEIERLSHQDPKKSAMEQLLRRIRQKAARAGIPLPNMKSNPQVGIAAKKPSAKKLSKRAIAIRAAINHKKQAIKYATYLDEQQIKPPEKWTGDGCPLTYKAIYQSNELKWKKRMWDEQYHEKRRVMKEKNLSK